MWRAACLFTVAFLIGLAVPPAHATSAATAAPLAHTTYAATAAPLARATSAATTAPPPGLSANPWRDHVRAARAYAGRRAGVVSFALRTERRLYGFRGRRMVASASVVKAMLMVAYLNSKPVRHRRLSRVDRNLIEPMVRRSDNGRATLVRNIVGNKALRRLARRVGMRDFATAPSWGATRITAADQTKLFLHLERFVVRRHRRAALELLGSIVPSQRWGLARATPPGWTLYFKGGWVKGIEHQVGLLRRGRRRLALAVLTTGNPSSAYGRETQRGVAHRLLRPLAEGSAAR